MPIISLQARLLQASADIAEGQWFIVFPNDTMTVLSEAEAQAYRQPKRNGVIHAQLTPRMQEVLEHLSRQTRPVAAGKFNSSGYLSKLKQLGFVSNTDGKWSITAQGKEAIT